MRHGTRLFVLFGTGIALGYGLRVAARTAEESASAGQGASRGTSVHVPSSETAQNTARQKSSRPAAQDVTLTREQWSQVLQFPQQYRMSLQSLRESEWLSTQSPNVDHPFKYFYGWSDSQAARMREALLSFKQAVDALEAERAIVAYPEPGKLSIAYGGMAEDYHRHTEDLRHEIQEILGEAKANKFFAVSNFNGLAAERRPDTKQEITFALDEKQNMQITSPKPDGINIVMLTGRSQEGVFSRPGTIKDPESGEPVGTLWNITMPVKLDMRRVEQEVRKHQIRTP